MPMNAIAWYRKETAGRHNTSRTSSLPAFYNSSHSSYRLGHHIPRVEHSHRQLRYYGVSSFPVRRNQCPRIGQRASPIISRTTLSSNDSPNAIHLFVPDCYLVHAEKLVSLPDWHASLFLSQQRLQLRPSASLSQLFMQAFVCNWHSSSISRFPLSSSGTDGHPARTASPHEPKSKNTP